MERDSIDRIRSATFPLARRGYDKREVDRFLNKLADWLETGGGDQTRAELLRRELERVGQQTGRILTNAHEVAEGLRGDAEREARRILDEASASADQSREVTDRHAAEVRAAAEAAAEEAQVDAERTVAKARAEAERIVDEANKRRADVEAVISDLEDRRDTPTAKPSAADGKPRRASTRPKATR